MERIEKHWWVLLLAPLGYAVLMVAWTWSVDPDPNSVEGADPGRLILVALVLKWLAYPSLPVLVMLAAKRIAERPRRAVQAAVVWAVTGGGAVLLAARNIERVQGIVNSSGYRRLWPTDPWVPGVSETPWNRGPGSGLTTGDVVGRELVAMVIMAVVVAAVLRWCARRNPVMAWWVVPCTMGLVILVYKLATPWSLVATYDFFVGDAVLGSALFEAIPFPSGDPIAAAAFGLASVTTGALLAAWSRSGAVGKPPRQAAPSPRDDRR